MVQALIEINGIVGSDDDLPINVLVQLSNADTGGELSYAWTILDKPPGSTAALSNSAIENPTFTPDVEGSYLLRLIVNGSGSYIDTAIAAVRQVKTNERVPAAGETDEVDAADGWAGTTGASSMLRRLDTLLADSNVITAYANGPLTRGQLVSIAAAPTIKTGLPGEERILAVDVVGSAVSNGEVLFVVEGRVDGNVAALAGELVRCRASGLFGPVALGGAVGDPVYWSADTLGLTPAGIPSGAYRMVGRVVALDAGDNWVWFNGLQLENEPTQLSHQLLDSAAAVSDAGGVRLRSSGAKIQVSQGGAAYVDMLPTGAAPDNAPYLTVGPVAGLSAEVNISGLTTNVRFKSADNAVVPLSAQKNSALTTADYFQAVDETSTTAMAVDKDGSVVLTSSATQGLAKSGNELIVGTLTDHDVSLLRNSVACWALVSGGHLGSVTSTRRLYNIAEPAAQHDAISAQIYGTAATTDGSTSTLASYAMVDDSITAFDITIAVANAAHTKSYMWKLNATFHCLAGTAVLDSAIVLTGPIGNLGDAVAVTMDANSNFARLRITGVNPNGYYWKAVGTAVTVTT